MCTTDVQTQPAVFVQNCFNRESSVYAVYFGKRLKAIELKTSLPVILSTTTEPISTVLISQFSLQRASVQLDPDFEITCQMGPKVQVLQYKHYIINLENVTIFG